MQHSKIPWSVSKYSKTAIVDADGNTIVTVPGSNEQSIATAAYIVKVANAEAEATREIES